MSIGVQAEVAKVYETQYQDLNESRWREVGAKYKCENILTVTGGKTFGKVLEVGAGTGHILQFLEAKRFADALYAVDISATAVAQIKTRGLKTLVEAQPFNGYEIPYPDKFFELVVLSHVLEHVEHERYLLREIKRVSEYQVIEVPKDYRFGVDKRIQHFLAYGHINVYTPTLLRYLLISEGYEIISDHYSTIAPELNLLQYEINRKRQPPLSFKLKTYLKESIVKFMMTSSPKQRELRCNAYTVFTKALAKNLVIG